VGLKSALAQYKEYLRQIRWPFGSSTWIIISLVVAIGFAALFGIVFFVLELISIHWIHGMVMTTILLIVLADVMIAYPYLKAIKRTEKINRALPDALKQMADTLKAGGTFEYALRGISSSEYGPLTDEMNLVLRRLEEGENLENSLRGFSRNVKSRVVTRAVNIILDSISAGASLADILDEIADDVKANQRIINERKSSTLMQVLFMVTAGAIVSPFIFGLVVSIVTSVMGDPSMTISESSNIGCYQCCQDPVINFESCESCTTQEASFSCPKTLCPDEFWTCVTDSITLYIVIYIIIETLAIGLMISLIREGKITKSFIYIPVLLLVSYSVFFMANVITLGLFGG